MRTLITGVSARAMAESACRAGWAEKILTVDHFGDLDLKRSCENYSLKRDARNRYSVARLLRACSRFRYEAVVYTANLENHPAAVGSLATTARLMGNHPATLTQVRNPQRFLDCLRSAGVTVPHTVLASRTPALSGAVLEKPRKGGGGHGITMVLPGTSRRQGTYLQEYISGLPCSVAFVANGQQATILGVSQQLIGDDALGSRGFRYCGSLLGKRLPGLSRFDSLLDRLERIATHLTSAFNLIGVNGLDFVLKGDEIYPLELNPRYTASMELVEMAYGINIFSTHLAACDGALPRFDLRAARDVYYGKAILFADRAITAPATDAWWEQGIRDIPFPGERIQADSPICTIFTGGADPEACYLELVKKAETLKQEIYS